MCGDNIPVVAASIVHYMHGYLSHVVQRIPEISQNGANVKEICDSLCQCILNL